jgi:ABC-type Mn2+/Zn2+ transport system permease subunit
MIMDKPASLIGIAVALVIFGIICYTLSTFETLIGPLIQYQGEYSKDVNDLNCSFIYLLFTAFGITGLLALSLMQKIEKYRKVNPMVHKLGPRA